MTSNLIVSIKCADESYLPTHANVGDAGYDLHSAVDAVLAPGERKTIPCGISIAFPEGHAGLVIPRSGLAAKHGITVVNSPGLIDSGYRGEICAILLNTDQFESFQIHVGDRIAQLVLIEVPDLSFKITDDLGSTSRGSAGFGSSGV